MGDEIVDLSKYNDAINWDVLAPQLGLAICRVQYGSNNVDKLYASHVKNLEARNVPHAAYAYGCYVSVADAVQEAKDFMARVNPRAKFLVLDCEDDTLDSCGGKNLAEASQAFIDTCKAAGWKVGFYVSHHMLVNGDPYGLLNVKADFRWIPRYGKQKPDYPCEIWQYADGETGGWMDGVGKVDRNRLNGDKTLDWFLGNDSAHKETGIGIATSNHPEGYGINLYNCGDTSKMWFTGKQITNKTPYLILAGNWYGGNENMLCLGWEQWVKQEHFNIQWFLAYSKYQVGYGINIYDAPKGNFLGSVDGSKPYDVWARRDGYIEIEPGKWAEEKHFTIK